MTTINSMSPLDKIMIDQLRKISQEYELPSVDTIADRMQQLAEIDWREVDRSIRFAGFLT
jgi:hypothetical protein